MKATIHPNWHHDCAVTCSCGNKLVIGSTQDSLQIDICSKCHPFFTGEVRFVDRQGRVDRFLKKQQVATSKQAQATKKKKSGKASDSAEAKSYRELLREQQNLLRKSAKTTTATSVASVDSPARAK